MMEILITTIIGNLIVLGISAGIIAIYFKRKAQQIENNDSELPIQDIFSEFLVQSAEVFRKELSSEPVQVIIASSVMEGITALFAEEENQKTLANFLSQIFKESVDNIIPQITGMQPLTESEIKTMDKKSDGALGAMTVNAVAESLPPGYGFLLDKIYPKWQEDAQKRPKDFIALISKANQWGLFNLMPGSGQANVPTSQGGQSSGF